MKAAPENSIQAPDETLEFVETWNDSMSEGTRVGARDGYSRIPKDTARKIVQDQYPGQKIIEDTVQDVLRQVVTNGDRLMDVMEYGPSAEEDRKMDALIKESTRVTVWHANARGQHNFLVLPSQTPQTVRAKELDQVGLKYNTETGEVSGMVFKDNKKAMKLLDKLNIQEQEDYPWAISIKATGTIV